MKRRDFLKRALVAAGGAGIISIDSGCSQAKPPAAEARNVKVPAASRVGSLYVFNRAPLQPTMFARLPIGSITPKGWLREQLEIQCEGLNGRMPEVSDYLVYEGNGWVTPNSHTGWEEVPYWLRGFGDLGYVTGNQRIIDLAQKWVSGCIESQQPDGWFGPSNLRTSLNNGPDMWPHMPMMEAIRSNYEYTKDPRIPKFLANYFNFQKQVAATNPSQFGLSWAGVRMGDNIESILWLYNRNGDPTLLDLATTIHTHSADYTTGVPTWHNVNIAQGFREPAEYGQIAKDPKYLQGTENCYDTVMKTYGQFSGGGFAGDENCRVGYTDPRQGYETCGVVEMMLSHEIMHRITGDPKWADRCENLAHNLLPAALDQHQKGTHYITSPNSIALTGIMAGQDFDDQFPMQVYRPGVHLYRCCPHNYGMGWPHFSEELWQATADNGIAAAMYAPSEVKAKVGDGTPVTISQVTDYPFDDTISFTMNPAKPVAFPFYLRIPGWSQGASAKINGKPVAQPAEASSYLILHRTWHPGDKVELHLPMRTEVKTWEANHNSVSVNHGPLTYSLLIDEDWKQVGSSNVINGASPRDTGMVLWPHYEVHPASDWNYGLELDPNAPEKSFDYIRKAGDVPPQPFTRATTPVEMRAKARKIPNWQADQFEVVGLLQPSPAKSQESVETVSLIPMGAARLRITSFPVIGSGPDAAEWVAPPKPYLPPKGVTFAYSHLYGGDFPLSYGNPDIPTSSYDQMLNRFTWWPDLGTAEWVEYDFDQPKTLSSSKVYWYDDTGNGGCRVPASWNLQYWNGNAWTPVSTTDAYGTATNQFNTVNFQPVTTTKIRLNAQLQPNMSGGILIWNVS